MLNAKNFGLALGITWGLSVFFMGLISGKGYGIGIVNALGTVYIGYAPGLVGSLLGLVYGLIDGFIGGFIIAWLYNYFEGK